MKQASVNASVMPKIRLLALSVVACKLTEAEGMPAARSTKNPTVAQMQDKCLNVKKVVLPPFWPSSLRPIQQEG